MAFTGTATVTQISDSIVRITGVSLAATTSGTIGLHGATNSPNITLPASFQPQQYPYNGTELSLADIIDCKCQALATLSGLTSFTVNKGGTTPADFVLTVANTFGSASGGLEIYVKLHT